MKIHVVGIGGAGMKGIAEIAKASGHIVTGSDLKDSENIRSLKENGIQVFNEHCGENAIEANVIVASIAINQENQEIKLAKALKIPVWSRLQALDRLLSGTGQRISVMGSCGKTSATAIIESVFSSEIKPTVYMGAKSKISNNHGSLGEGKVAIIESCEYQGAFFDLRTDYAVLTDIVSNHEDYFGAGTEMVSKTFINFIETSLAKKVFIPANIINNTEFNNYINDARIVTYGVGAGNWCAEITKRKDFNTSFELKYKNKKIGDFEITLPGEHNVKHSIPAIALALEFGISINNIKEGLLNISLPGRRFDVIHQSKGYIGIDDNARNPEQLAHTLSIISENLPVYKKIAVAGIWGYRNPRQINEFAQTLKNMDFVFLPEVGNSSRSRGGAEDDNAVEILINQLGKFDVIGEEYNSEEEISDKVNDLLKNGPVVLLTFGYDSYLNLFNKIHKEVISKLESTTNTISSTLV